MRRAGGVVRVVGIIQARVGSLRLPGKVMLDLGGRPMLSQVLRRCATPRLSDLIVATSRSALDDPVVSLCERESTACFRGEEADVLGRLRAAADAWSADAVVRLTADNPVVDAELIEMVVGRFLQEGIDYLGAVPNSPAAPGGGFCPGLAVEVLTRQALEAVWRRARTPEDREHVTLLLRRSGAFSSVRFLEPPIVCQGLNLTVDTLEQYRAMHGLFERLGPGVFSWTDAVAYAKGRGQG